MATRAGPLDLLGRIEEGLEYDDLLSDSVRYNIEGHEVQVLSLRRYTELKEKSERPKDQAVIPLLRATLEERESGED